MLTPSATIATVPYSLRVASINLWNPGPKGPDRQNRLAELVAGADIVTVSECTSHEQLRYIAGRIGLSFAEGGTNVGILSRYPLTDARQHKVDDVFRPTPINGWFRPHIPIIQATAWIHGLPHYIFSHHWAHQQDAGGLKTREKTSLVAESLAMSYASIHGGVIFGGDFNAQPGDSVIQRLVRAGLRDALTEAPAGSNHCKGPHSRIDMILYRAAPQNALGITRAVSYQGECSPVDVTDHPVVKVELEGISIKH